MDVPRICAVTFFVVVVDVVTELARMGLSELPHADHLVSMSETVFESKG